MPKKIIAKSAQWNFGPGSLWTHRGWQYAAYWDDARQVSVARRQLPDKAWEVFSLPDYQRGNTGDRGQGGAKSRGFGDGHEKVSMGISPDGVIHLSFDHHVSSLRYRATTKGVAQNPSAHSWNPSIFGPVQNHLGGPAITKVTYPMFSSDGTHFTFYLRLNGGSGNADSHLFSYANGKWVSPSPHQTKIIDRKWSRGDKTVNAYPHQPVFHKGRLHLTWSWRDTPKPNSSHDLCYAYSDDQGKTWRNNEGKIVGIRGQQFLTADTPGIVAVRIPPGSKFVNGGSMTVDHKGHVQVIMRGEKGNAVHFNRDPNTKNWKRRPINSRYNLHAFRNHLYFISDYGVWRSPAGPFQALRPFAFGNGRYLDDSKRVIDRYRQDGWVSVIGQKGKTVRVLDYQLSK